MSTKSLWRHDSGLEVRATAEEIAEAEGYDEEAADAWTEAVTTWEAIRVDECGGFYSIPGAAEAEDWVDVRSEAIHTEKIDDLRGWGKFTAAYRVEFEDFSAVYFVED